MITVENLKIRAKNLKTEITAIYYAYQNPKTKLLPKILILITIGYALSPIDLIPDFIPVLGYLDDLLVVPVLISLTLKIMPKEIMDESREKARKEPLTLRKNWFFAILFILIWVILLFVFINAIMGLL
jgi:uncharacterized membrane protein YkvA (DUF1232 family)